MAGFNPKRFLVTYLAAQHDIEIWLAPFAGSRLMVPYRVSIPTRMGLGILQATKFELIPARSAYHQSQLKPPMLNGWHRNKAQRTGIC